MTREPLSEGYNLSLVPILHTEEWVKFASELIEYRMRANKLTDKVFYGTDKCSIEYIEDTILLLRYIFSNQLGYLVNDRGKYNGFIALTDINPYRAEITFCMFPEFRSRYIVAKSKELLRQLAERPELSTILNLYGFIAVANNTALKYARLLGFKNFGRFDNGYINKFTGKTESIILMNYPIKRGG